MTESFGAVISGSIAYIWKIVLYWWWLPLFFVLNQKFIYYWKWWRREIWWNTKYKPILVEVTLPKLIEKPIKAMEIVFTSIHGVVYDPPDWWEVYVLGQPQTSVAFDIVSIGGEIHFYLRFHSDYREQIEAAIYSQYPEAEIQAVADYAKAVPLDMPNKDWDIYGWDFQINKQEQYPIKTYEDFEESGAEEEEKTDPLSSLLEGMAKLKAGEQLWIHLRCSPRGDAAQKKFYKEGEELRDRLAFREAEKKTKPLWSDMLSLIFHGVSEEEEKAQELIPLEMKLTPGERELIESIEKKISKPIFNCNLRVLYLARKEAWCKPNYRAALSYFNNFTKYDANSFSIWPRSETKVHLSWFLPFNYLAPRLEYVKKRRFFRVYRGRDNYFDPLDKGDKGLFKLNVEELATIYHFPSLGAAPTPGVVRTEAKETVAPSNLPI